MTIATTLATTCATVLWAGQGIASSAFPEMEIARGDVDHEWPFSVDAGTLTCVEIGKQKTVIFAEPWRTDVPQEFGNMTLPRSVIVSANPFAILASMEDKDLYLAFDDLETLIRRLAPFEAMGRKLCDAEAPRKTL